MDYLTKIMTAIYRRKLKQTVARHGTTSSQALQVSRRLDRLVLDHMRQQAVTKKQKAGDFYES